jgi:hypothetical protein
MLNRVATAANSDMKIKLSIQHVVEAHRVVRYRGFHTFYNVGSQMIVMLSTLRSSRPLPPEDFWYLFLLKA